MIFRLEDGKVPPYRQWFDLLDFLTTKGIPSTETAILRLNSPDSTNVEDVLNAYAISARNHLGSFLSGDFSEIPNLELIAAQRKRDFQESEETPPSK